MIGRWIIIATVVAGLWVAAPRAQPVFRGSEIFPPEEFAARRAKVMAQIGDAVAIVLGATEPPGEMPFRQNSQFFYLTGVVEPRAVAVIDGRTKQTTVFLQPSDARRDGSMFGPALAPGAETAKAIGVDVVLPREAFTKAITALAADRRVFFTPFAAEVLGSQSQGDPTRLWRANKQDPWDGRDSREGAFIEKLKAAAPQAEIKDLDPIVNALRAVKSAREIALLREATRIAGDGIIAAMRHTRAGLHEYELQAEAEYVFKKAGALGAAYFALVATGENTYYTHYHRNTAVLKAGDLVQFDYAPDYKYYQSDVTRVFPVSGTFTPRQRELYEIYLKLYQALMTSIAVHKTPSEVIATAVVKMDAIMASYHFTDDRIKAAAAKMVEDFRARKEARALGHNVGLEVHDVGGLQAPTFEPGRVFTIEPQLRVEEEHLGIRLEDMILITETGYENLSQSVPIEVADIEKVMGSATIAPPVITAPKGSASVEQTTPGPQAGPTLVESFEGIGAGFSGPQGEFFGNNPSDNSLAVGPDHVVQIVNSRTAIFTKKGKKFKTTGQVLYGPVPTNNVFKGFGGACESTNNGDAVVRYDQLADRWLIVMPIFRRMEPRPDQPDGWKGGQPAYLSPIGVAGQPGPATPLFQPPPQTPAERETAREAANRPRVPRGERPPQPNGPYAMCYAVSTSSDPLGSYYRYEFLRALFPDYPRPAVWPDGYYIPTSTSDDRISETVFSQKHACVADRQKMLKGEPATEQCLIVENVNFFNTSDLDGRNLPPPGAPNILLAAGGLQLDKQFEDNTISAWQFHVDWTDPTKTAVTGPQKISVAPYHYLCDGQLTNCVPQPGTDRRLDSQGDKIMSRLTYRRVNGHESVIAVHSINTTSGGGGVRWYEFRVNPDRTLQLHQQGTFLSDGNFRWLPSAAMDKHGNIGIGYSYGGEQIPVGQRFAGRLEHDPLGQLTRHETVLAEGAGFQSSTMRWEDYSQTAIDPLDDCTIWYVGDYLKKDAKTYSSRIGAFRLPGCS